MDRNLLWDRTEKAYSNLTDPDIQITNFSPKDYIEKSYAKNITDEFIEPIYNGEVNFSDIAIQMFSSFLDPYPKINDGNISLKNLHLDDDNFATLTDRINPKSKISGSLMFNE